MGSIELLKKNIERQSSELQNKIVKFKHTYEATVTGISCLSCMEIIKEAVVFHCGH